MATEISDWNDLDNVRNDLTGDYVLVNDLDSETDGYAGVGDDFNPIGPELFDDNFHGTFDGQGNEIADLDVSVNQQGVGLFTGVGRGGDGTELIENLSVSGSVTDTGANGFAGGVAGRVDNGTIENCVSHVDVTSDGDFVGGLVGDNSDTVTESYATGSVEGNEDVGGLVGDNSDTVTESYATGSVEGNEDVGGLVGDNSDTVTESYATGSVEGDTFVGGLVGRNADTVTESYATGSVDGNEEVGGLVGRNVETIKESYATGSVEGNEEVGGLVGGAFGTQTDSYWDTETSGQSTSDGDATGLTTDEMQGSEAETNMDGFDFADEWFLVIQDESIDEFAPDEDGYPILQSVDEANQLEAQNITFTVAFTLSVETNAATDISVFSATLNGELVELDAEATDADVFFEFGETVDQNQTPTQTLTEPATFDELIDELEPNTTFEFRAVAEAQDEENETFTDEGDILTFDTEIVTLDGTITLDETAAENADVFVHNLTQDTFEGRLSTDTNGDYSVDLPDANREDTVAVAVDFADGLERYGRLITTVLE